MALTWRNVDAPDMGTALQAYRSSADTIGNAFTTARGGLKDWEDRQVKENSNQLMAKLMTQYQNDPEGLARAAKDGSLMAGYDPRMLSAEAIASIGARTQDLQNFRLGTSNIAGLDLRNAGQSTQNKRGIAELDTYRYNDRNVREDTDLARGVGRDLSAELNTVIASKGLAGAKEWYAQQQASGRLKGLPSEFVNGLYSQATGMLQGEANLDRTYADTNLTVDNTLDGEFRRAGIRANTANTIAGTGIAVAEEGRRASTFKSVGEAGRAVADILANSANTADVLGRLESMIASGDYTGEALGIITSELGKRREGIGIGDTGLDPSRPAPSEAAPAAGTKPANFDSGTPAARMIQAAATGEPSLSDFSDIEAQWRPQQAALEAPVNANPMLQRASFDPSGNRASVQLASAQAAAPRAARRETGSERRAVRQAPREAPAARVMNYQARDAGFNTVPNSVRTLGQASEFAKQVNRAGVPSSAMGTYQIVGQTLRNYAPRVLGKDWQSKPYNQTNQDKIARQIFLDHRGSADKLRGQWVSLSRAQAEQVRKLPWKQARVIIARGESGNGGAALASNGQAYQDPGFADEGDSVFGSRFEGGLQNVNQMAQAGPPQQDPLSGMMYGGRDAMAELLKSARPVETTREPAPIELMAQPIMASMLGSGRIPSTNVAALLAARQAMASRA